MSRELLQNAQPKMQKAFDFLAEELKTIRSGRANATLVEQVNVDVYGQPANLRQLASISTPDGKTIAISPWDPTNLEAIEKAIREDKDLGLNPQNDGKSIHINVPPLTAERREQMVKQVGEKVENCYITLRSIRHEVLNEAKSQSKEGVISEDEYHHLDKQLAAQIDDLRRRIEELAETKKQELREV